MGSQKRRVYYYRAIMSQEFKEKISGVFRRERRNERSESNWKGNRRRQNGRNITPLECDGICLETVVKKTSYAA